MKLNNDLLAAGVLSVALIPGALADVLYENTTTDLNVQYDTGTSEVGNQVSLAGGTAANITEFTFQYWAAFSGTESLDFRIYANNGPNWDPTYKMPGTELFDSGTFSVPATVRQTVVFDTADFGASGLSVPNGFTWTVQFSNLGGSGHAGVGVYGPPTVGLAFNDVWVNTGTPTTPVWGLKDPSDSYPGLSTGTFAAEIDGIPVPVPEPSPAQYGSMCGAVCLVRLVWKRLRGKANEPHRNARRLT